MTSSGIEHVIFELVALCVNQVYYRLPLLCTVAEILYGQKWIGP
jgi:hypothetical protein